MKTKSHFRNKLTLLVLLLSTFSMSIAQNDGLRINSVPFQVVMNNVSLIHTTNTAIDPLAAIDSLNQIVFVSRNNLNPGSGHYYVQSTDGGQAWSSVLGAFSNSAAPFPRGVSILLEPDFSSNPQLTRMPWVGSSNQGNALLYGNGTLPYTGTPSAQQSQLATANTQYVTGGIGRAPAGQYYTMMLSINPVTSDPDSLKLMANVPASTAPITPWVQAFAWDIIDTIPCIAPKVSFSPDGNTGWIVALSDLPGQGQDSSLSPIYWKSTNGGTSWTGPSEVDFSNWQCLLDSIQTATLPVLPTTTFEFDLTVDNNGNPHILCAVMNRQAGSEYTVLPGARKWVVDITTPDQGNNWRGILVEDLHSFRGQVQAQPASLDYDNNFQIGRSPAGDRIFYSWTDTDSILNNLNNNFDNIAPDLITAGFSTFDSSCAGAFNWTFTDLVLSGTILFHHLAPEILVDTLGADTHRLPIISIVPSNTNVGEYVYLSDIYIPETAFDTTFLTVGNGTCGSPCANNMCVWPGDADASYLVDMDDLLMVGTNFDSMGPPRANASLTWVAQPGTLWPDSTMGVNMMHSDCDGNGHVFWPDTIAIQQNYNLTHNKTGGPDGNQKINGAPSLTLVPLFDSLQVGQAGIIEVHLGDSLNPADSIYGIRYTFHYDPALVDTNSVHVSFPPSWLGTPGTDLIGLYQDFYALGKTDIGMVRTDQTERQGYGTIAHIAIVAIDNISGKRLIETDTLDLGLSALRAIRIDQSDLLVGLQGGSALIWDSETGSIPPVTSPAPDFRAWPNPAGSQLNIEWSGSSRVEVRILDQMGRTVLELPSTSQHRIELNADQLSTGLYFLNLNFGVQQTTKRLVIQH